MTQLMYQQPSNNLVLHGKSTVSKPNSKTLVIKYFDSSLFPFQMKVLTDDKPYRKKSRNITKQLL